MHSSFFKRQGQSNFIDKRLILLVCYNILRSLIHEPKHWFTFFLAYSGGLVLYYLTVLSWKQVTSVLPRPSFQQLAKPLSLIKWIAGLRVFPGGFHIKKTKVIVGNFEKNPWKVWLEIFSPLNSNWKLLHQEYKQITVRYISKLTAFIFNFLLLQRRIDWLITQFPVLHILFHCCKFRIVISVSSLDRVPKLHQLKLQCVNA